jgi:hypothetical protein
MTRKAAIAYRVRVTSEPSPHHRPLDIIYMNMNNIVRDFIISALSDQEPPIIHKLKVITLGLETVFHIEMLVVVRSLFQTDRLYYSHR